MEKVKAKRNAVGHLVVKLSTGQEFTMSEENGQLRVSNEYIVAIVPVACNVVRIRKEVEWYERK